MPQPVDPVVPTTVAVPPPPSTDDFPLNNTVRVVIEQEEAGVVLDRRVAIEYPNLPNMLANELNRMLAEGVDEGIDLVIETLSRGKAAVTGQTVFLDLLAPVRKQLRKDRLDRMSK